MGNPVRGEVELVINGQPHSLCLTLGALAEIEALLGEDESLSAKQVLAILQALLRGGGNSVSQKDLLAAPLTPEQVADAIAQAMRP